MRAEEQEGSSNDDTCYNPILVLEHPDVLAKRVPTVRPMSAAASMNYKVDEQFVDDKDERDGS